MYLIRFRRGSLQRSLDLGQWALVGGVAQWLGHRSLAGVFSLTYA